MGLSSIWLGKLTFFFLYEEMGTVFILTVFTLCIQAVKPGYEAKDDNSTGTAGIPIKMMQ